MIKMDSFLSLTSPFTPYTTQKLLTIIIFIVTDRDVAEEGDSTAAVDAVSWYDFRGDERHNQKSIGIRASLVCVAMNVGSQDEKRETMVACLGLPGAQRG